MGLFPVSVSVSHRGVDVEEREAQLLKAAMKIIRDEGGTCVSVAVPLESARAISRYEAMDFVKQTSSSIVTFEGTPMILTKEEKKMFPTGTFSEGEVSGVDVLQYGGRMLGEVAEYEARETLSRGAPRPLLLAGLAGVPGNVARVAYEGGQIVGFGVARRASFDAAAAVENSWILGPLYAARLGVAVKLLDSLLMELGKGPKLRIFVPEANTAGINMAEVLGLTEKGRVGVMVMGGVEKGEVLQHAKIFGVASLELG